jgi:NADPH:quinone reductase-like Zn-dependent oxidoreductase
VLQLAEVEKPAPKHNEILIKVHFSTVSASAVLMRQGKHPSSKLFTFLLRLMQGITKPRNNILGFEFSGEVEAIGNGVQQYSVGDKVYGTTTGLKQGAYAQYLCVPEKWRYGVIAPIPKNTSFTEAAALPISTMTVLHLLKKAALKQGQKVLVYGASGSVGTYAVQLVKYFGGEVVAVCSTKNIELVKSLGADDTIDYTQTDISKYTQKFDVVFDAVGKLPSSTLKKLVKPHGKFVSVKQLTQEKAEYLALLEKIIVEGKLKPVIDRVYNIDEIIAAHQYADLGHKRGNVLINIANTKI